MLTCINSKLENILYMRVTIKISGLTHDQFISVVKALGCGGRVKITMSLNASQKGMKEKLELIEKLFLTRNMDDLRKIFNPDTYLKWSKHKPERFYIPLILLYTGCRIEEEASLYCEDVLDSDGIWCISINDNNDRTVKNLNAIRTIPLHPVSVD